MLYSKVLAQQPLLGHHIVPDPHPRELRHRDPGVRAIGVVGRGREAAADLVHANYEIFLGVQRVIRADVEVAPPLVRARVPGRDQDCVVFSLVELAERRRRQVAVRDGAALFEVEPSDADQGVFAVVLVCVERVLDSHFASPG